ISTRPRRGAFLFFLRYTPSICVEESLEIVAWSGTATNRGLPQMISLKPSRSSAALFCTIAVQGENASQCGTHGCDCVLPPRGGVEKSSRNVPNAYWNPHNRQANLDRNNPDWNNPKNG